jgi:hypothetical protein
MITGIAARLKSFHVTETSLIILVNPLDETADRDDQYQILD